MKIRSDPFRSVQIRSAPFSSVQLRSAPFSSVQLCSDPFSEIERISRGIYILPAIFEDSYYTFGQKYKKAIFSHMNALYFYWLTEEFPHDYTVTVPRGYHVAELNKKCNVFFVPNEYYELGLIEAKTPVEI